MKRLLLCCVVVGCGFGDNNVRRHTEATPDASTVGGDASMVIADAAPDATVMPACTLIPQAGCTGTTPACDLTAADDGTVECRAVIHQGTANDHCDLATDCKAGYTCVHDHGSTNRGWCDRFCASDSICTGTGSRCTIDLVGNNGQDLGIDVCSNACDPYGQTGCPTGMGCLAFDSSGGDYTDCEYMGSVQDGDPCTSPTQCLAGSTCVGSAGNKTCEQYCIAGNDSTCPGDLFCESFASPLVIGSIEYGSCQ